MGVFTRFKDIINSNINAMLDNAEDPEKMISMMIREMEDTIVELKTTCAQTITESKGVQRELKDLEALKERWNMRARLAVEKGKDELAKEALLEKKSASNQLEIAQANLDQFDALIAESKKNILDLEEKLENVKQKKRVLAQRATHAAEKRKARETLKKASGADAAMKFDELEERIIRMEADADLAYSGKNSSSESEFFKMEKDAEISDELDALKRELNKAEEV